MKSAHSNYKNKIKEGAVQEFIQLQRRHLVEVGGLCATTVFVGVRGLCATESICSSAWLVWFMERQNAMCLSHINLSASSTSYDK